MTLPTRADGGIDWDKTDNWRFSSDAAATQTFNAFGKLVATLTRERCARDLQLEAKDYRRLAAINHPPLAGLNEQISIVLEKRASAIRGMED